MESSLLPRCMCVDNKQLNSFNSFTVNNPTQIVGAFTFVHEQLGYTLLDQSPSTLEIKWLCVDVDGYKIVNVYKPLPTRLRTLDLPVFPHPCLYAGDFNCCRADWGYDNNSPDSECLAGWASTRVNQKLSGIAL